MNKLTTYATLIGVIGAIGGGFYTWGEFNTRLDAIESKKSVSLAPINTQVLELRDTVSALKVDLIDRIDALREKVEAGNEVDLSALTEQIEELANDINADLDAMKETLTKVDKEASIALKENELQDEKIEAIRLKATNPLAS
jgi:Mg2+ and Co2+ transporter CorA|tara:strand:- start:347 stop:772 length:426 start_codon:yes stop_codon:yes gene_type:complete